MSAEPQDARIGWFKWLVVGAAASSAGIGSPTAHAKTSRRTSSPDAPVRVGCLGDRSSLGSARGDDPSALQTLPPGDPWRAGYGQAASGDQAQPADDCRSSRLRRAQTPAKYLDEFNWYVMVGATRRPPHVTSRRVRAQSVTGFGSYATEEPWDENDILLVRRAVEAHIRAAAGSRFHPPLHVSELSSDLSFRGQSVAGRTTVDRIVRTELCNRA